MADGRGSGQGTVHEYIPPKDGVASGQVAVHEFTPPKDGVASGQVAVHEFIPPEDGVAAGMVVVIEYTPPVPYVFRKNDPVQGQYMRTKRFIQGQLLRRFPGQEPNG